MGRQHQRMDRPGVRKVPEGGEELGKWRKLVVNHLRCPNDLRGQGIDEMRDES